MTDRLWQRLGAASGTLYVVLLLGGSSIGGGGEAPETAEEIRQLFVRMAADRSTLAIAFSLILLSFLCFLVFLGSLWNTLRQAEGANGWLSVVALGGGLVWLSIRMGEPAPIFAALHRANTGLNPQ